MESDAERNIALRDPKYNPLAKTAMASTIMVSRLPIPTVNIKSQGRSSRATRERKNLRLVRRSSADFGDCAAIKAIQGECNAQ
jgi:hypothetical protein